MRAAQLEAARELNLHGVDGDKLQGFFLPLHARLIIARFGSAKNSNQV
jgi:hypothetical protein